MNSIVCIRVLYIEYSILNHCIDVDMEGCVCLVCLKVLTVFCTLYMCCDNNVFCLCVQ